MPSELVYNATLTKRIDISDTLAIFRVKPDEAPTLGEDGRWFDAGQYMVIGLNNEEVPELAGVRRPMSIASPPQDAEEIDFYIKYVSKPESENPLTHLLWKVTDGARMHCRAKATGKFTVESCVGADDPRLRLMVGAGTGLAPFICMVDEKMRMDASSDLSQWVMMHGVSYPVELGYRDRLERMAAENKLHYLPTVSRPNEAPDWKGDAGRVEDYFKEGRIEELEERLGLGKGGLNPDNAVILICGLMGTIRQTVLRTLGRGFIPDNRRIRKALEIPEETKASLFFEQYDTTPVIDVKDPAAVAEIRKLYGRDL